MEAPSDLFAKRYLALSEPQQDRVDELCRALCWRAEHDRPMGAPHPSMIDRYVVVGPPMANGSKIRILYRIDRSKKELQLESLTIAEPPSKRR